MIILYGETLGKKMTNYLMGRNQRASVLLDAESSEWEVRILYFLYWVSANIVSWDFPGQTVWFNDSKNSDGKAQILPLAAFIWWFWWKQMEEYRSALICVIILIAQCGETPFRCPARLGGTRCDLVPFASLKICWDLRQLGGKMFGLTAGTWPEVSCLGSLRLYDPDQVQFSAWSLNLRMLNWQGYWGWFYQTIMREAFAFLRQHVMAENTSARLVMRVLFFFLDI